MAIRVFYDLETTGLNTEIARIVQFAACLDDGEFVRLVQPEVSVPRDAVQVHGLDDEALGGAPTFSVVWTEFLEWMRASLHDAPPDLPIHLIGHNSRFFDDRILATEIRRHDVAELESIGRLVMRGDTLIAARELFRRSRDQGQRRQSLKLSALYEFRTGRQLQGAHDALVDCKCLRDLFSEWTELQEAMTFEPWSAPDVLARRKRRRCASGVLGVEETAGDGTAGVERALFASPSSVALSDPNVEAGAL